VKSTFVLSAAFFCLFTVSQAISQDDDLELFIPGILAGASNNSISSTITDEDGNSCVLTEKQLALLNQHNAARSESRQCGTVSFAAASPLRWNCTIASTAIAHSVDMERRNLLTHKSADGKNAGDRLTAAEYDWMRWAENIASGRTTVTGTMQQWLQSAPHCSNLMNPDYTEFGGSDDGSRSLFWTAVFASKS